MKIPQTTLDKIVEELPHGAQNEIADYCNYSYEYVNSVFCGRSPITDTNIKIIYKAQAIIRDARDKENNLKNNLKNLFK